MQFLAVLLITLVGAVHANPLAAGEDLDVASSFDAPPSLSVVDLTGDGNTSHPNSTVGGAHAGAPHVNAISAAAATYPASIVFCRSKSCASCTAYNLQAHKHKTCFTTSFGFNSAYISQPSNAGLPFGVFIGPSCSTFVQIPSVNTCYNVVKGGPFRHEYLSP